MSPPTILAIDVGNSRIKFGLFARGALRGLPESRASLAVRHSEPIPWQTIVGWLDGHSAGPIASIAAGVNPRGMERLVGEWPTGHWPRPKRIDTVEGVLEVRLEAPGKVGIDRLLNAVAVNRLRPDGQPAIVVGSGTATTVDSISSDGAFLGGAILPGFELAARSLNEHTALLPLVLAGELTGDLPALGRDTPGAIRSGLLYGQVGAVKELVARLSTDGHEPLVVVTGGNGALLASHLGPGARFEPDLPLRGLAWMAMQS